MTTERSLRAGSTVTLALAVVATVGVVTDVSAHRRDEYLQATRVGIEPSRIEVQLDLTPGIAVAESIIAAIDSDRDGALSPNEMHDYIAQMLKAIDLRSDGGLLRLESIGWDVPDPAALRRGEDSIRLRAAAPVRLTSGPHQVSLRNSYRPEISVYMANTLAPDSDRIAVGAQRRDPEQRELVVDYTVRSEAFASSSAWKFASIAGLLLVTILWLLRVWCRPACPRFDRLDPRRA